MSYMLWGGSSVRQMKRLFKASVLLLCCLLLASCAPQKAQENTPVTLTALQYELENQVINFSDMWFYDQLEEETNVHVDFVDVKGRVLPTYVYFRLYRLNAARAFFFRV